MNGIIYNTIYNLNAYKIYMHTLIYPHINLND